jgi:hypothetical protein
VTSTPPPTDPRATHHDRDEAPVDRAIRVAVEARALAQENAVALADMTDDVEELKQLVGRLPSALPGDTGSGLAQHVVNLTTAVTGLRETIEADRREREEQAKKLAASREPWSRTGWLALGAAIAAVVGTAAAGAYHWIVTLHH